MIANEIQQIYDKQNAQKNKPMVNVKLPSKQLSLELG